MAYITPDDLEPFAEIEVAKAEAMIADAVAQAIMAAPCLATEDDLDDNQTAAVRSVLRQAVLRWNEMGSAGGITQHQQSAGPFADNKTFYAPTRRALFWPSEIEQMQAICAAVTGATTGGSAYGVDTVATSTTVHADTCSINFGADYCSCGASIAGVPLWA